MVANLETIGPDVLSQPLNNNFAALNSAKVEKSGDTMAGNISFSGSPRGLVFRNGNTQTTAELADFPDVTTADAVARLFRNTNTTGNKIFQILKGDATTAVAFQITNGEITNINGRQAVITAGNGSPQGVVTAPPGAIYLNTAGGAGTTLWYKASGTGNTGWTAVA